MSRNSCQYWIGQDKDIPEEMIKYKLTKEWS